MAIGAFFPVYTTVSPAHVNPVVSGLRLRLKGLRLLTTVQLPAVLPSVVSVCVWRWLRRGSLVAAELLGAMAGCLLADRLAEQRPY